MIGVWKVQSVGSTWNLDNHWGGRGLKGLCMTYLACKERGPLNQGRCCYEAPQSCPILVHWMKPMSIGCQTGHQTFHDKLGDLQMSIEFRLVGSHSCRGWFDQVEPKYSNECLSVSSPKWHSVVVVFTN